MWSHVEMEHSILIIDNNNQKVCLMHYLYSFCIDVILHGDIDPQSDLLTIHNCIKEHKKCLLYYEVQHFCNYLILYL